MIADFGIYHNQYIFGHYVATLVRVNLLFKCYKFCTDCISLYNCSSFVIRFDILVPGIHTRVITLFPRYTQYSRKILGALYIRSIKRNFENIRKVLHKIFRKVKLAMISASDPSVSCTSSSTIYDFCSVLIFSGCG